MESFLAYLKLGWEHILDLNGYDHLLFVAALTGIYMAQQWRQLLLLVTAFTLGHSLTLLLSSLEVISLPPAFIEFLIPLTIATTCITNWFATPSRPTDPLPNFWVRYALAFVFGLVHGMGFSNYLKQLFSQGNVIMQLLSFNLGLELGQLVIVFIMLVLSGILLNFTPLRQREWNLVLSSFILGLAMVLVVGKGQELSAAMAEPEFWSSPAKPAADSTQFSPFGQDTTTTAPATPDSLLPQNATPTDTTARLNVAVDSVAR